MREIIWEGLHSMELYKFVQERAMKKLFSFFSIGEQTLTTLITMGTVHLEMQQLMDAPFLFNYYLMQVQILTRRMMDGLHYITLLSMATKI